MSDPHVPTDTRTTVQLLAAGFNAFGQLNPNHKDDVREFETISTAENVRVLFSCWSSTVLVVNNNKLIALGFQQFQLDLDNDIAEGLKDGFGDHNGMIGCLDSAGRLYLLASDGDVRLGPLDCQSIASSPQIMHLAHATNGKIAIAKEGKFDIVAIEIVEFGTLADFLQWFQNPINISGSEPRVFDIPGRPKLLLANIATFLLLTTGGTVYTWGDSRYQSLGRLGGDSSPAESPAILESLEGLRITKIACGGWMNAALSEDGALYIWGTGLPGGQDPTIKPLREVGGGDVALVDIFLPSGELVNVDNVGVGHNHIVLNGENGGVWGVGSNRNGQLGIDHKENFIDDWKLLRPPGHFSSVVCGAKTTWLLSTGPDG